MTKQEDNNREELGSKEEEEVPKRVRNDNPRTTSAGFDPEALERGVKTLNKITSSSEAKKVCLSSLLFL